MKILITGGTGFVGRHTAVRLLAQGYRVRLMGRNFAPVADLLKAGAERAAVDLRDRDGVIAACAGVDAVIHCGALSAPWGVRHQFFATNVGGTEAVIAGCRRHRVARLVFVSSPAVVFADRDIVLGRDDAPYPARFSSLYALTKKLGEERVLAAADLPSVIVRPKAVFGPGDTALLPRVIAAAQRGRLPLIGTGRNRVDLTYVENVAYALELALRSEAALGRIYTVTNGEHPELWAVIGEVLERLAIRTRRIAVPLPLALAVATVMEGRAALSGREPLLTRYSALLLACTQTYDITPAQRDLGYTPIVSLREGIERTIADLQKAAA